MINKIKNFLKDSPSSFFLILLGCILLIIVLGKMYSDNQIYNSPFDQLDSEQGDIGALPILVYSDSETGNSSQEIENSAPHIDFEEFENLEEIPEVDIEEIIDVMETQSYLQGTKIVEPEQSKTQIPTTGYKFTPEPGKDFPPTYISIPSLGIRAPILDASVKTIEYKLQEFQQWVAPDSFAVGWHNSSAKLDQIGNTVLTGHHNAFGEVFKDLYNIQNGDLIYIYSDDYVFVYVVGFTAILNERFETVEKRIENANWILPSDDERITLITCWPYESNTHRVIVVAVPIEVDLSPQGVK